MKGLIDDWNYWLDVYLNSMYYYNKSAFIGVDYFKKYKLKLWKYWWRLDCWTIPYMVDDYILIKDVEIVKQTYFK